MPQRTAKQPCGPYGLRLGAFLLSLFANGAAAGFTADLPISS